jgi:hypothetical protein
MEVALTTTPSAVEGTSFNKQELNSEALVNQQNIPGADTRYLYPFHDREIDMPLLLTLSSKL